MKISPVGLVDLKKYGFLIDNHYRKWYTKAKIMQSRKSVADALVLAKKRLPDGYNFKITEGKRTLASQRLIVAKFAKKFEGKLLEDFAGGYPSITKPLPPDTHRHGGALDLTIVDKRGKELSMGGRTWTAADSLRAYERNSLSRREKEIRDNRRLLATVMKKAGFKPHLPEWWHWKFRN